MARIEKVTMTNMCMVFDGNKVLVQDTWFCFIKQTSLKGQ